MDKHAQRTETFNSTLSILRQGWYPSPSGQRVDLPSVDEVMDMAVMYSKPFHVLVDPMESITTEIPAVFTIEYSNGLRCPIRSGMTELSHRVRLNGAIGHD